MLLLIIHVFFKLVYFIFVEIRLINMDLKQVMYEISPSLMALLQNESDYRC